VGKVLIRKSSFLFKQRISVSLLHLLKTKFREEDEHAITQWMKKNLLVLVVPNANYEDDETEMIEAFNPPLNLDKNHNVINLSFRMKIKDLRNREVEK